MSRQFDDSTHLPVCQKLQRYVCMSDINRPASRAIFASMLKYVGITEKSTCSTKVSLTLFPLGDNEPVLRPSYRSSAQAGEKCMKCRRFVAGPRPFGAK
jgi:hypothetical protein